MVPLGRGPAADLEPAGAMRFDNELGNTMGDAMPTNGQAANMRSAC